MSVPTQPIFRCFQQFTNSSVIPAGSPLASTAGSFTSITSVGAAGQAVISMFLRFYGDFFPAGSEQDLYNQANGMLWFVLFTLLLVHLTGLAFDSIGLKHIDDNATPYLPLHSQETQAEAQARVAATSAAAAAAEAKPESAKESGTAAKSGKPATAAAASKPAAARAPAAKPATKSTPTKASQAPHPPGGPASSRSSSSGTAATTTSPQQPTKQPSTKSVQSTNPSVVVAGQPTSAATNDEPPASPPPPVRKQLSVTSRHSQRQLAKNTQSTGVKPIPPAQTPIQGGQLAAYGDGIRAAADNTIKRQIQMFGAIAGGFAGMMYSLLANAHVAGLMFNNVLYTTYLALDLLLILYGLIQVKFFFGEYEFKRAVIAKKEVRLMVPREKAYGSLETGMYMGPEEAEVVSRAAYFRMSFGYRNVWLWVIYLTYGRLLETLGDGCGGYTEVLLGLAGWMMYGGVIMTMFAQVKTAERLPDNQRILFGLNVARNLIYVVAFLLALIPMPNPNNYQQNQTDLKEAYGWKMVAGMILLIGAIAYHLTTIAVEKLYPRCCRCVTGGRTQPQFSERTVDEEEGLLPVAQQLLGS